MARSADSQTSRTALSHLGGALLLGAAAVGLVVLVTTTPPDELWPLLASAIGIGVTCGAFTLGSKLVSNQGLSWRAILWGAAKWLTVLIVAAEVLYLLLGGEGGAAGRATAVLVIALAAASLAYLLFVSARVRLLLPGIEEEARRAAETDRTAGDAAAEQPEAVTIQVARLSARAARIALVNDGPLPVLKAQTSLSLAHEGEGAPGTARADRGQAISLPAHSTRPITLARAFDHVGIYQVRFAGVRVFDLFGLLSRTSMTPGSWRVRVVPNIYRIPYGIPRDRRLLQETLGIPDTPADALDYDRVREYRPGDPLKNIHWKLSAHSQGELYTKLFETPTITATTLTIDPFGPSTAGSDAEIAYHLHDTMLEGAFSLIEHAHENDIAGRLRFVRRDGTLVEAPWAGLATRSWFVETARRPQSTHGDATSSILAVQALRTVHEGYAIFATSCLTEESVEALIAAHHAGVPLLVVHALPHSGTLATSQRTFDERLRAASITVVALTDGTQIVREVSAS